MSTDEIAGSIPGERNAITRSEGPLWPVLAVLFGVPVALLLVKWLGLPASEFLADQVSLTSLPEKLQGKLGHILFVPLGAMLVVLVRLTLGLRVLGPFRAILLAVAFQTTGVGLGIVYLAVTTGIVVGIRPLVGALRMPYFGRITVMLSTVAVLMTLAAMVGSWLEVNLFHTVVYFPVVVLCLVADSFGRAMKTEGPRSAIWRGGITVLVAVALAGLASMPQVEQLLLEYPELLLAQIGTTIFVSRRMAWRWLERFNPKVVEDEEDEYEKEWLES